MSRQQCENVKRETVHCHPRNVDRCCTWSEKAWCCRWNLGAFFKICFFFLFCYITNHLMTGPEVNSEFCFPRNSIFPSTSSRETLRFLGNKIYCSPRDQSLSVYCSPRDQSLSVYCSPRDQSLSVYCSPRDQSLSVYCSPRDQSLSVYCSPRDQSLSVYCSPRDQSLSVKWIHAVAKL